MKKLIFFMAAAAMVMLSACSGGNKENGQDSNTVAEEKTFPEQFTKSISGCFGTANVKDAFEPAGGDANFTVTNVDKDSVAFTVEILCRASNTEPVNSVKSIKFDISYDDPNGAVKVCDETLLPEDEFPAVLEMCKKADSANKVPFKVNGKVSTEVMEALVNAKTVSIQTIAELN